MLVVLIRKVPALAELPKDAELPGRRLTKKILKRLRKVDWAKYQRVLFAALAALVERLRRFSVRFARKSESGVRQLRQRLSRLQDNDEQEASTAFSSRIKKRSAFLEEERQLIEQLTANPDDVDAYRRLGNLYVLAGNDRDAKAAFTEVLRLDPENEEARKHLVDLDAKSEKARSPSREPRGKQAKREGE